MLVRAGQSCEGIGNPVDADDTRDDGRRVDLTFCKLAQRVGELVRGVIDHELELEFLRHRNDKRSALLIGIHREDEMLLNPVGTESGALKKGDQLILLSRVFLTTAQTLPTIPPIQPVKEESAKA